MPKKIEKITAFLSVDDEGNEGIIAEKIGDTWMPFIAADMERLISLFPAMKEIAKSSGKVIRIKEFTNVEDVTEKYIKQYGTPSTS